MDYTFLLIVVWAFLAIFGMIRIEVASNIRQRRLDEISTHADLLITRQKTWGHLYDEFHNGPSLKAIALDLTKWTVRSVYEELK